MKHRISATVIAFLTTLTLGLGFWDIDQANQRQFQAVTRMRVLNDLSALRANLEGGLNSRLFITSGLISYVALHPDISTEEFPVVAKRFLGEYTGIRSIQLARNTVVSHIYPVAGNEAALGLELLKHPTQQKAVTRAIESGETIVAGPVDLIQGGRAFIGRTPIYLADTGGKGDTNGPYWGLATVLITYEELLEEADIHDQSDTMKIAIRRVDGLGEAGGVFFGDASVFDANPILLNATIPNGSWQLAATPPRGWPLVMPGTWPRRFASVIATLFTGLVAFLFIENMRRLRCVISAHAEAEEKLSEKTETLDGALEQIDSLADLLPICAQCKKIRNDQGYWNRIEDYLRDHADLTFTHGYCPECVEKITKDIDESSEKMRRSHGK